MTDTAQTSREYLAGYHVLQSVHDRLSAEPKCMKAAQIVNELVTRYQLDAEATHRKLTRPVVTPVQPVYVQHKHFIRDAVTWVLCLTFVAVAGCFCFAMGN